jgi:hypothetical protein
LVARRYEIVRAMRVQNNDKSLNQRKVFFTAGFVPNSTRFVATVMKIDGTCEENAHTDII